MCHNPVIQIYFRKRIKSNKIKQDLRMDILKIFNVNANILSVMICVLDKTTTTFEKWMRKPPQKKPDVSIAMPF